MEAHSFMKAYRQRQHAAWMSRRDAEVTLTSFNIGDLVILHTPTTIRGVST